MHVAHGSVSPRPPVYRSVDCVPYARTVCGRIRYRRYRRQPARPSLPLVQLGRLAPRPSTFPPLQRVQTPCPAHSITTMIKHTSLFALALWGCTAGQQGRCSMTTSPSRHRFIAAMVHKSPVSSVSTQVPYVYMGENYTDPEMRSLHAVGSDSAARARPEFHTATDRVRQKHFVCSVV